MPQFNATLIFVLLSFVVFMLLMKVIYFDPMLKIKIQRERQLEQDSDSARQLVQESVRLNADYDAALHRARREAQQIIQTLRQEAKTKSSETLAQARQNAQADMERQMAELAAWREKTYQELEPERRSLMQTIIQKIVEHRPVGTLTGG